MDDDFLQYDLDWFLSSQEGYLAHFATAGQGPIPERIKSSVEDYNFIFDYIYSLEPLSEVYVIEGNLPAFQMTINVLPICAHLLRCQVKDCSATTMNKVDIN